MVGTPNLIPEEEVEERATIVRTALLDETLFGVQRSDFQRIG
jgi:hypothetical protein